MLYQAPINFLLLLLSSKVQVLVFLGEMDVILFVSFIFQFLSNFFFQIASLMLD